MTSKFSANLDDETIAWLRAQSGNVSDYLRSLINLVRDGQLVPKSPDATDKDKEQLAKELLAVTIAIKKNINERQELEKQYLKSKKDNLDIRNEILQVQLHRMNKENGGYSPVAVNAVPSSIETEIAKDTAKPEPRKQPSHVTELPAGQGLVGCDNCNEVFIFDNADAGLDDFLDHIEKRHRRREVSHNEANQFRRARDRIAKEATA